MANYASLLATIASDITDNNRGAITGPILKSVLDSVVGSLGTGYQFMGVATPTSPGTSQTPDYKCFYLAATPGTYTYLGGLVVADGEVAILKYDSAWHKEVTGAVTASEMYSISSVGEQSYSQTTQLGSLQSLGFTLKKGTKYKMYIKFTGFSSSNISKINKITFWRMSGSQVGDNFNSNDYFGYRVFGDGEWHETFYTPDTNDIKYIKTEFITGYEADDPAGEVHFKAEEYKEKYVRADELDTERIDTLLSGSSKDYSSSFASGYYALTNKSIGDRLISVSVSSDLMYAVVPISKGDVIKSNTQLTVTATVGHILVDDEYYIIAFPTTAQINAGFSLTDEQAAAGAKRLIIVYRISTQTNPISVVSEYSFGSLDSRITKPIDGKTVILCGDSQVMQARGFEDMLKEKVGGTILNCGFGAARMSLSTEDRTGTRDMFSMVNVADCLVSGDFSSMDESDDLANNPEYLPSIANLKTVSMGNGWNKILTIAYGGNDFAVSAAIGDVASENPRTYLGALAYAVDKLLTAFPRLTILVVGMPYRVYEYETVEGRKVITEDSDQRQNALGKYRYDYNDALVEGAGELKIPAFDMYRRSGRNKFNIFYLCPDGTHPTNWNGKESVANLYAKILQTF